MQVGFGRSRSATTGVFLGLLLAGLTVIPAQAAIRTIVVSPVPGDALASGAALLSAVAAITDANATNRYLVKIEPGIFDLNTSSLVMKQYVDIEGSIGTRVQGKGREDFFGGVVVGASNSGLRDLTVVANGNNTSNAVVAIYLALVDTKLSRVRVVAQNAVGGADAILVKGGAPRLDDVEAIALNGTFSTGLALELGTAASVRDSILTASGGSNTNRALLLFEQNENGALSLSNLRISASGGQRAYGIEVKDSTDPLPLPFTAADLTISATGASIENVGIWMSGYQSTIIFHSSRISAEGAGAIGVHATSYSDRVSLHQCMVKGASATVKSLSTVGTPPAPHVQVGGTFLDGGPVTGLVSCAGVYDEDLTFFPNTCP